MVQGLDFFRYAKMEITTYPGKGEGRVRIFVFILFSLVFFSAASLWGAEPSAQSGSPNPRFTLEEKLWAIDWINKKLSLLMEDGLIERIKCSEDNENYEVLVSSAWGLISPEGKRDFLQSFSRAREIIGHSPYLVIKDSKSGEVLAQVNQWGIFIFGE